MEQLEDSMVSYQWRVWWLLLLPYCKWTLVKNLGLGPLNGTTRGMSSSITTRHKASLLLMVQKSGDHQLSLVVYPIIYRVFYIPGGDRRISSINSSTGRDTIPRRSSPPTTWCWGLKSVDGWNPAPIDIYIYRNILLYLTLYLLFTRISYIYIL